MLGVDPVERRPDTLVIVAVHPAREGDALARGHQNLGLGPASGHEKIAAVNQRGRERPPGDLRSRAGPPCAAGVPPVGFGGVVAEGFKAVPPVDQHLSLAEEAFELDRLDLRAVLLALAALLGFLVVVEEALNPVGCAVEYVGDAPEEIGHVGFGARVRQRGSDDLENLVHCHLNAAVLGRGSRVRLVGRRLITVQLEPTDDLGGRGRSVRGLEARRVAVGRHRGDPLPVGRAHRGLRGDHLTGAGRACTAARIRGPHEASFVGWTCGGRSAAEDGGGRLSCLARRCAAPGKKVDRSRCVPGRAPVRSPPRRPWAPRSSADRSLANTTSLRPCVALSSNGLGEGQLARHEACYVLQSELDPQARRKFDRAELDQVLVEITQRRCQPQRFDPGGLRSGAEVVRRVPSCGRRRSGLPTCCVPSRAGSRQRSSAACSSTINAVP